LSATRSSPAGEYAGIAECFAAPRLSARSLADLEACLEPLRTSCWPDVAWRSSRLTVDGCPVEFAFSSGDDLLRITLEPTGPECDESQKLECALRLLAAMDRQLPQPRLIEAWRTAQAAAPLRWGAWVGLRQSGERLRSKLYVEVPRDVHGAPVWPGPLNAAVRMIGHEPDTRRTEFYYSLSGATPLQLSHALARSGVTEPHVALEALAHCMGLPLASALRWAAIGFSMATEDGNQVPGAALFFRAGAARGASPRARAFLLAGQHANGRHDSLYERLFGQTDDRALPDHGVIAVTVQAGGNLELRVGVSGAALLQARATCLQSRTR
jgi:hypothetical protein